MKRFVVLILSSALFVPPAVAQEGGGLTLMERGALLFMEGMLKEMEPAIEEFSGLADDLAPAIREFADQMGPRLNAILEEVEDWSAYEVPEILPNGDIIIRRKAERPVPKPAPTVEPAPQIEL